MSTRYWLGKAPAVAQVSTVQVTAYDAATTYTLTVGGVEVSAIGNTDVDTIASDLATAWNDSTHAYFTGVTASTVTDTIHLTADTAGVPFVTVSSVTGGTGTIGAVATGTANSGPNDWSTAANWSAATVPVSSDTVVLADSGVSILWGLDQSAVTLAELRILQSFSPGLIGLPSDAFTFNATGASTSSTDTVDEYRDHYLKIGATLFNCGVPGGGTGELGSGRIKIDFGSVQTTATVFNTGATPQDTGRESMRLLGTHASNTLFVSRGLVGTATENASEVSTWSDVNTADNAGGTLTLNLGAGCTLTDINCGGGVITNRGANVTGFIGSGGLYLPLGSATHTTIQLLATARCVYHTDGLLGTLDLTGFFDTRADARPKTITNVTLHTGFELLVGTGNPLSVTITNGIDLDNCALANGTLDVGNHLTLSVSAI